MAPKKANKKKQVAPLPDPSFSDLPLPPLHLTADTRLTLLPWLAKGFCPSHTSGKNNLCGVWALWRAFREAQAALNLPGEKIHHISKERFDALLKGPKYRQLADRVVKAQSSLGFVADEDEFKKLLAQKSNLDITQIGILLEVANEEAGTNFALGYVTEGWRCRLNKATGVFDNSFVRQTTASLAGDVLGDTASRPARPVIWLWNDNNTEKQDSWGQGDECLNHWEAFGNIELGDDDRYARVRDWHIGDNLEDDLRGVWMVTQDRTETEEHELAVIKGTYVRNTVPNCIVPRGWRFVAACNNMQGLVPENILSSKILTSDGSSLFNKRLGSNSPASVAGQKQQAKTSPASVAGQKQQAKTHNEITQNNNPTGHDQLELRFFRAISPTDKMGQETSECLAIGEFNFKTGDILLDSTERYKVVPTVITANGKVGEAHFRRLQYLESAWGLPSPIRGIMVNDRNMQEIKGKESGRVAQYQHSLPLYRLTESYSVIEAEVETAFFKDEIVRGLGPKENDDSKYFVLDFESNLGIVDSDALETFGRSGDAGQHDYPFGIQLLEDIPTNVVEKVSPYRPKAPAEILFAGGGSLLVPEVVASIPLAAVQPSEPIVQARSEAAESDSSSAETSQKSKRGSEDDDLQGDSPKQKKPKTG